MSAPVGPPLRLWRHAVLAALAYLVVATLYFSFADRLLGTPAEPLRLHPEKGWVFIGVTTVALFALLWQTNVRLWRRARREAALAMTERQHQARLEGQLDEVNQQLRLLLDGTPSFFFYVHDAQGLVTYVSPTVKRITGRPVEEWVGQSHWFVYDESVDGEAGQTTPRQLAGQADSRPLLVEIRHADGHPVLLEIYEHGRFEQGKLTGLQGIAVDVTERRQAAQVEAAVQKIAEAAVSARSLDELFPVLHRIVTELMPAQNLYIALHDPASDLVSFAYWVDEKDPCPEPRRGGRGLTEYVIRTGRPLLTSPEVFRQLRDTGEVDTLGSLSLDWLGVPLRFHERTIGVLAVQSYTERFRYGDREKQILEFVSTQIAMAIERTRAEEALRESEERYRRLVELSPDGIVIHAEGRLVFVNQQGVRLMGLDSADEAVGVPVLDFVHPDDRWVVEERVRRGAELREPQPPLEERFLRADGSPLHVEVAATPFQYQGREATLVVFRDISERLRTSEQLRQAQKMEAVGQLAGGVAHDFNNLLQALLAAIQVLRSEPEDRVRSARTLDELEAHVRRGASMTRQLLLFSRRDVTRGEPLDLDAVVGGTAEMLRRLVPERVRMQLELAGLPLPVEADRGQLEQVLVNLVLNACDAMPDGGELVVATGGRSDRVWLEVRDTGSGVPDALRGRIFEPFFTTKPVGKGSGLGLAVVHGIVTAHGGRVEVETGDGSGSAFRVILPREETPEPWETEAAEPPSLPRGGGERVLLVEDEPATRDGLAEVLNLLGYRVTAVESAENALAVPTEPAFQVLLTDLALPGLGGTELGTRLVARWPDLGVILMSGYAAETEVRRAAGEGRLRFLQKPFPMEVLAQELVSVLQEKGAVSPDS